MLLPMAVSTDWIGEACSDDSMPKKTMILPAIAELTLAMTK